VGLAERAGLVADLTAHVLSRALEDTADRWRRGLHVPTSVNVTLRDLTDGDLAGLVVAQLDRHGLPAEALVLEVTESSVMHDPTRAEGVLHDLAGVGVRCWLDDFGTGSSSLALVERLPVSAVKVDRTFVRRLDRDDANPAMVRSIVGLAHGLDLRVVAEGVQTAAAWKALVELGADTAQGWHVARPMPAEAAERWLVARSVELPTAGPALRVVGGGTPPAP
jgi:EAL domain-containing protein (putative c-di-GMP-specific phosphodiesterase class I)